MKLSETLRYCTSAFALAVTATANALPIHFELAASEQWHTASGEVANVVYGVSAAFDSDATGRAGSTSIFMAASFGEARAVSTDSSAALGTSLTSRAEGFGDADAHVTGGDLSAWASTTSLASVFGYAFVFPNMDLLESLSVHSAARVDGRGDSLASLKNDGLLRANSGAESSGAGLGAASIANSDGVLVQSKTPVAASTVTSAFAQAFDLVRSGSNGAVASSHGVGETPVLVEEAPVLRRSKQLTVSRVDSSTDAHASAPEHGLASRADGSVLAEALAQVLALGSEAVFGYEGSGTAFATGFSEDFVSWSSDYRALAGGARAGYLIAISEQDFVNFASPDNLSAAAGAVDAIAFGYTEAWVERIPEPATLLLLAAGMAALGLRPRATARDRADTKKTVRR
jgi:hypothetical protein